MATAFISRRTGALAVALAVAASTVLSGFAASPAVAVEDDPAWQSFVDVAPDYLVDTYDLPADHVFETVTFERFEWLLNGKYDDNTTPVTGTFAFLIADPNDPSIKSEIGYINDVAKQYGVDKVYTFDPALDGNTLNVWDTSALNLAPAGKTAIETLGNRLITSYLNKDTAPAFTKTSTDPYLFIYDKGHTVDVGGVATEDRIVSSLNVRKSAADFEVPGAVADYKAQVGAVFDAVSVEGVADVDSIDQGTFWKAEVNRRHHLAYPNAATNGGSILDNADLAEGWRIQTLTYPELKHLVQQEGDYVILFGGTWCHNTRAVIKQINKYAQEHGITKVYNFDNSLDSTGNASDNYLHIRDTVSAIGTPALPRRASYLYGDLWNTYFPNVVTEYRTSNTQAPGTPEVPVNGSPSVSPVTFYPGGDTTLPLQNARKGQVPFLLHYNKDNISGSTPAPVVSQWIHHNDNGSFKEYMIEWWQTPTAGPLSGNTTALAFAAEAETALQTFFTDLPGAFEITTVSASAEDVGGGSVKLTATVYWCNSIAQDAAGTVEFFRVEDGEDPVSLGSTTTFDAGQASLTIASGPGAHEFYAVFTPSESSDYSTATSPNELYSVDPITTTLAASATNAPGSATLTATVKHGSATAAGAPGTVEFFAPGEPATSLGSANVTSGAASITLSDWVPGEHAFYAVYTPAEGSIYLTSTSDSGSYSIGQRATTLVPSATSTPDSVTLSATVQHAGATAAAATGSVEFFAPGDPATSLGSAAVTAGVASLTLTGWEVGDHGYSAAYTPTDGSIYLASTAAAATVTVPLPDHAVLTIAPVVTGELKVGKTLGFSLGANYPGATAKKIQWLRNGKAISKATGASYLLTSSDRGTQISVTVTASRSGITNQPKKTSAKTAKVGYGDIQLSSAGGARLTPTASGTFAVGSKLTTVRPDYATSGLTFAYQWLRDGVAIKGATASSYTLTVGDLDKQVGIRVTAKKTGYANLTISEVGGTVVVPGTLSATAGPKIAGTKKVGSTLAVSGVKWSTSSVTTRYAWYADGELIQLSTSTKLKLSWAERGTVITVKAFGSKPGYVSAESALSTATSVVK